MNYFSKLTEDEKILLNKYDRNFPAFTLVEKFYDEYYPTRNYKYSMDVEALTLQDQILIFLHENIFRSLLLFKSYINGISSKNPLQSSLSTRAQFETCGAVTFLHKKYNQYLKGTINEDAIKTELLSLLNGVRNKEGLPKDIEFPDPKGVMSLIDSGDYFHKHFFKKEGAPFRRIYEHLSEVCHPNAYGYILHFRDSVLDYKDPDGDFDKSVYGTSSFLICMTIYTEAYKDLYSSIIKD
ncbi:hypothetical protein RKD55_004671 [Rossellomorea marisflavi]